MKFDDNGCTLSVHDVGEGIWLAYGFENTGTDKEAPARLLKRVRRWLLAHGATKVWQHRDPADDPRVWEFWDRYGFKKHHEVHELCLTSSKQ